MFNILFNRFISLLLGSFMLVLFNFNEAYSIESDDPYIVQDILVDITSSSTSIARDIALNKAQKIAYKRLINRLVVLDLTRTDNPSEPFGDVPGWDFTWGLRSKEDPMYKR